MAAGVNVKIATSGEEAFKSNIAAINAEIKNFGAQMDKLTSEFDKNANSEEALAKRNETLQKSIDTTGQKLRLLNEHADRQRATLAELGKALDDAAKEYGNNSKEAAKAQKAYNEAQRELSKTETDIAKTEKSLNGLNKELGETGNAMDDTGQKTSLFGDMLKANIASEAIIGTINAIKDAVLELGQALMDYSNEAEQATTKATAYFGETGAAAEETEGVIRDVFTSGVGDSMDQVADAVIAVKRNIEDLSAADMTALSQQALQLENLYGVDMDETLRGASQLMEQFKLTSSEAMDLIVAGTQNGLDVTNELGDNITEYAGKFSQAGYSAEEYFQLLQNGMDNGAYTLDKVNDAMNEVTTKLSDGTIAENLSLYSDETQRLFKEWQTGGATQKEVIDSIVSDIGSATNQQEALTMAATAFGSIGEDNNLAFVSSLTSVGAAYEDVDGKAAQFYEDTMTNQQKADAAIRTMLDALSPIGDILNGIVAEVLPQLAEAVTNITSQIDWETVTAAVSGIVQGVIDLGAQLAEAIYPVFEALAPIVEVCIKNLSAFAENVIPPLVEIIGLLAEAFSGLLGVLDPEVTGAFELIGEVIYTIIGGVLEFVASALELIIGLFSSAATVIPNAVSGAFNAVQATISSVMTAVGSLISSAWSAITGTVSSATSSIKSTVSSWTSNIKSTFSSGWNAAKSTVSSAWNSIKSTISTAANNIYSTVSSKIRQAGDAIKSGFQGGVDFVQQLPSKFLQWGKDMIGNLVEGITSKIGAVRDAISNIADTIRSYIHFSEPDVGPLADFNSYMPDMIANLTSGIRAGIPQVQQAMNGLTSAMIPATANGAAAAYDRLSAQLGNMQIVLDDGTLVGKLGPKIDATLGGYTKLRGRYYT